MRYFYKLLILVLILSIAQACEKKTENGKENKSSQAKSEVFHEHKAPHGGSLIEVGEEFAHIELIFDAKNAKITAYALDGEAEKSVRLKQKSLKFKIILKKGNNGVSKTFSLELKAVANSLTGEMIGDTSQFEGQSESLKNIETFTGILHKLEIKGSSFSELSFSFPAKK